MNKPSIFKNTAVITAIACFERALGFLYRILLARLLGAEGMGIYQIALSHFFLFQTAAGGGIPVSLSRTVSRLNAENQSRRTGGALLAALILAGGISLPEIQAFRLHGEKVFVQAACNP
jgi:stage V sporulation protein B